MSIVLIDSKEKAARDLRAYIERGRAPGNRTLNRRTQPNTRSFVTRIGYNTVCSSYTSDVSIDRLSGSTFNRTFQQIRKNELSQKRKEDTKVYAKVGQTVYDYHEYRDALATLRAYINLHENDQARFSRPSGKFINRLPMLDEGPGKTVKRLHVLSPRSKGKIKEKATAFYRAAKQRTFATLTFIQGVDDKDAIRILNNFFTNIRMDNPDFKYLWVAERQVNNFKYPDNIHFHCVFNMWMDVKKYNSLWVLCQYNEGLRFEDIPLSEIRARHEAGTMGEILNPFDIEKIKNIYGINYYLTKYITKNKSTGFHCLAWHCSRVVSRLFTRTVAERSCLTRAADPFLNYNVSRKTGEVFIGRFARGAFHQMYYIENKKHFLRDLREMEKTNKWILEGWLPDCIPQTDEGDLKKYYNVDPFRKWAKLTLQDHFMIEGFENGLMDKFN